MTHEKGYKHTKFLNKHCQGTIKPLQHSLFNPTLYTNNWNRGIWMRWWSNTFTVLNYAVYIHVFKYTYFFVFSNSWWDEISNLKMSKPKNVEWNHEEIRAGSPRQFFSPTRQQLDAILLALCKNIFILAGFRLTKRNF